MTIKKFVKRKVVLTNINRVQWSGVVETYTPAESSQRGEEELGLRTADGLFGFAVSEISTILED